MSALKLKSTFLTFIFSGLLLLTWCSNQTLSTPHDQVVFLSLAVILLIIGLTVKKRLRGFYHEYSLWLGLINISLVFVVIFHCWNIFFTGFSSSTSFRGNIFRGAFSHLRSPMYGHLLVSNLQPFMGICIGALLFAILFLYLFNKNKFSFTILHWMLLFAVLLFGFAWEGSFKESFLSSNCHYATLAADVNTFSSVSDIWHRFSEVSGTLSVHNNHYPPGNLILLKLETTWFPFILKPLVLAFTLFSLIPLHRLLHLLKFEKKQIFYCVLFYITSGGILFFPGIDPSAIALPASILGVYYIFSFVKTGETGYVAGFGIVLSAYLMFSFMAFFYGAFCFILLIVLLLNGKINFNRILLFGTISAMIIILLYYFLYLLTDFNLLDCFRNSMINEDRQMASGADNISRYLIVSSGNLIAYIAVLGIPALAAVAIGCGRIRQMKEPLFKSLFTAVIITLLLISFSGQFFLETERIWIVFTPFVFIIGGYVFNTEKTDPAFLVPGCIAAISLITSVYFAMNIDFCS